jgi:hypothetical protein
MYSALTVLAIQNPFGIVITLIFRLRHYLVYFALLLLDTYSTRTGKKLDCSSEILPTLAAEGFLSFVIIIKQNRTPLTFVTATTIRLELRLRSTCTHIVILFSPYKRSSILIFRDLQRHIHSCVLYGSRPTLSNGSEGIQICFSGTRDRSASHVSRNTIKTNTWSSDRRQAIDDFL